MEHLVYVHDLEVYRIDDRKKEDILAPCEDCGGEDIIYMSWEKNKREEVLYRFLTGNDKQPLNVAKAIKEGQDKDDLVLGTRIYFGYTREIINSLYKSGSITKEKQLKLLKENKITEKKQLTKIKKDTRRKNLRKLLRINQQ